MTTRPARRRLPKNVRLLIGRENVAAVLGPANSGNALAMIPIMQEAQKPLMLLTASATKLTSIYRDAPKNYIFRATLPDREQIKKLLDWASPRFPRLGIACDTTPYGQLAKQDMTELMAERGPEARCRGGVRHGRDGHDRQDPRTAKDPWTPWPC